MSAATEARPSFSELPPATQLSVAYLVNQYPKVSHTFIRREIQALENSGVKVARFSIRGSGEKFADEADCREKERTRVILGSGAVTLLANSLFALLSRPRRFLKALLLAIRMGWRPDRGMIRNLAYLAEACVLLRWLGAEESIEHVHAHFATNSAAVVMLCHVLGGPAYSFTVHGPNDFDVASFIALDKKIAHARFVVTVSSFGRSQLYRWCDPSDWTKIHVVHQGLDDEFLNQPPVTVPVVRRFVCIGRLTADKGHLLLLDAMAELVSEGTTCEVVLIGDGPLRQQITARIEQLRLGDRVLLAGALGAKEIRATIWSSRALVLPSLAENLPIVIMEAFALNRPVIATNVAGVSEVVESGVSGWLIAPGSVAELKRAMKEALEASPDDLESMGKRGAARVHREFRAEQTAKALLTLFMSTDKV